MQISKRLRYSNKACVTLLSSAALSCQFTLAATEAMPAYSPYVDQTHPKQVFFGDTHVHTAFSADAGFAGNRLLPDHAYRFARGETIISSFGIPAKLQRPLDFLVISDHAENLGLPVAIAENNPQLLSNKWGKWIHELAAPRTPKSMRDAANTWAAARRKGKNPLANEIALRETMWQRIITAADKHNTPGQFTAFIGFEWSLDPGGDNLHRNVIFRDNGDKTRQVLPASAYDVKSPEALWSWMQNYETHTAGRVLAIPHNGNLSNGLMFDEQTLSGEALTKDYAEKRSRWEPLYEVTQMKGDAETHPLLSADDEFADFETWDKGSFGNQAKSPDMLPKEYARSAYRRGLAYEERLGASPFKFGMIGSSDTHTALSTTREENFFGKLSATEPGLFPMRLNEAVTARKGPVEIRHRTRESSASGLAAIWAQENTRESLWDAMARKEVYATTGTRIQVRLFGGWRYQASDLQRPDFTAYAYAKGVPMGGDLNDAATGKRTRFLIKALRDPDGANLDRIQIIKGWLDATGKTQEHIWDVAVSDGRQISADGRCHTPVGNSVNITHATYSNAIVDAMLEGYWEDPNFDPEQRAFYYVRVLEIPTPRWTTIDAAIYGIERPEDQAPWIQERAYTSPIWYTP